MAVSICFNCIDTNLYLEYRFLHQNQLKNLSLQHISRHVGPHKQWTRGWDCTPMTLSKFQMSLDHPWKHIIFISSTMKTFSNQTWCIKCQVQLPTSSWNFFPKKKNKKGKFHLSFPSKSIHPRLSYLVQHGTETSQWSWSPLAQKITH